MDKTAQIQRLTRRSFLAASATALFLPGLALPKPAKAANKLDELRASGAIGERFDGYLMVRSDSGDAKSTVQKINGQRRKIYEKRAKSSGVTVDQIGRVYAEEIMEDAPKGTYFLKENGQWVRK